jgi:hypothetical protein
VGVLEGILAAKYFAASPSHSPRRYRSV